MTATGTIDRSPPPGGRPRPMELDPADRRIDVLDDRPDALAALAAEPAAAAETPAAAQPRQGWPALGWAVAGIAALVAVALCFDAAALVARAFAASNVLGVAVSGLLAAVVVVVIRAFVDELRGLGRLRRGDALRAEAERVIARAGHGDAAGVAARLKTFLDHRPDTAVAWRTVDTHLTDAHDDRESLYLVEGALLVPIDRDAYGAVVRAARDTALATALSPSAVLDLAIVLWRTARMTREVAGLYGVRPGPVGQVRLIRRLVSNLAVAGLAETAHHAAVDALGGSLAAAVSARIGQGLINGLLAARLGVAAMHACRPMPFGPERAPNLLGIRAELLRMPKEVF